MLRRNYDLVATAGSAGVLLAIGAPWPLWLVLGGIVTFQVANRITRRSPAAT
ncbi:hypothetical protein [Tsukamurella asaccharolytica]|uniref:hypothetical protein n=1 Tax=Tsukamurella asaccharolytica TaxID=2592067 RepID=UPI00140C2E3E|nr:hypothetical protein [Tsukamurella asaccharolytica]